MLESDPLPILYQDEHLVAIHKPAGWLVHRTGLDADETRFVVQTLRDQLGQRVYPVHRLDKGTSGVLLMALSSDVARSLVQAFEGRRVYKSYLAMVRGWPEDRFVVDHALRPDDAPADAPAQSAQTRFECVARLSLPVPVDRYPSTRVALVRAEPLTGRRHQIRRHLKHVSHPIIGDATHGKGAHNRWWAHHLGRQRLWLHAQTLALTHPVTGAALQIHSDLAEPFNQDWQALLTEAWSIREDGPGLAQTTR
ncbi:MAG: pseudouridine synthase [Acidobacteriota bacterium]